MRRSIKAYISRGDEYYVGECLEIGVVTQGHTLDETIANLREAVALFLEGEDPHEFDLVSHPSLLVTLEVEPATHVG
jgi:predicted RNase H-like HicB family nuclease